MSYQASEAVRDHSRSRGAARTVGFVLATYADKYGRNIFVGLDRIMAEAKVNRKSAVDGRRWFLENGEAELVDRPDGKPLMRGRVRVMSMAPLLERAAAEAEKVSGSECEQPKAADRSAYAQVESAWEDTPLARGAETEPQQKEGSVGEPLGVRSVSLGVRSVPLSSSPTEPDTEGNKRETEEEPEDARAGARDDRSSTEIPVGLALQAAAARGTRAALNAWQEDWNTLDALRADRPTGPTQRAIRSLEGRLGVAA